MEILGYKNIYRTIKKLTVLIFSCLFVPRYFLAWSNRLIPALYTISLSTIAYGCYIGLYVVPADVTQGEVFRIIYIHVPLAVLSLLLYLCVSVCMLLERGLHLKMAGIYAHAAAVVGLLMTVLTLITGMIWAKPTWGVWWVWDARLTSEAILAVLYIGYLIVRTQIQPKALGAEISAYIAWIGTMNIPLVHYSVNWWFTLHQGPSVLQFAQPKMPWTMLYPLLITGFGFILHAGVMVVQTARCLILSQQNNNQTDANQTVVDTL